MAASSAKSAVELGRQVAALKEIIGDQTQSLRTLGVGRWVSYLNPRDNPGRNSRSALTVARDLRSVQMAALYQAGRQIWAAAEDLLQSSSPDFSTASANIGHLEAARERAEELFPRLEKALFDLEVVETAHNGGLTAERVSQRADHVLEPQARESVASAREGIALFNNSLRSLGLNPLPIPEKLEVRNQYTEMEDVGEGGDIGRIETSRAQMEQIVEQLESHLTTIDAALDASRTFVQSNLEGAAAALLSGAGSDDPAALISLIHQTGEELQAAASRPPPRPAV